MNYLSRNRLQLGHDEDPALPGYTELGARAGGSSVLSSSEFGADGRNPWENAPIHLMQLLSPALSVTGYAQGCMWTWPGYQRPAPPAPLLYSYPGANVTKFPASQSARESPFVPGDFVGLPQGVTTGPHLYVLAFGAGSGRLTGALTGPNGSVAVRTVDNSTSSSLGNLGAYLPPGGIIIPVAPLTPNTTYTAYASFTDGARTLSRIWSFGTAPVPDTTAPVAKLTGRRSQKLGKTVAVTVSCISETCLATARGSARAPKLGAAKAKTHTLKKISKAIVKGTKVKLKLKLTGKARTAIRRRLKSRKRVTVKVRVVVVDATNNARTLRRSIKLKL